MPPYAAGLGASRRNGRMATKEGGWSRSVLMSCIGGTARAVARQEKGTVKMIIPTTTPKRARPALRNCRVGSDAIDPQSEITAAASPPQAAQVRIAKPVRKCQSPPRLPNPAATAATAASKAP